MSKRAILCQILPVARCAIRSPACPEANSTRVFAGAHRQTANILDIECLELIRFRAARSRQKKIAESFYLNMRKICIVSIRARISFTEAL